MDKIHYEYLPFFGFYSKKKIFSVCILTSKPRLFVFKILHLRGVCTVFIFSIFHVRISFHKFSRNGFVTVCIYDFLLLKFCYFVKQFFFQIFLFQVLHEFIYYVGCVVLFSFKRLICSELYVPFCALCMQTHFVAYDAF